MRRHDEWKRTWLRGIRAATLISLFIVTGCGSVKEGLQKAVIIEYDQRNNFGSYTLDDQVEVGNGLVVTDVVAKGIWASFVLCTLLNKGSKAEDFQYDVHKFYVDIDGQKFFYQKLQSGQWIHQAGIIDILVSNQFESETLVPGPTHTFPKEFVDAALNYRFVVFIPAGAAQNIDPERLILRYDGYPNVLTSRNHPAEPPISPKKDGLATVCRPQAQ